MNCGENNMIKNKLLAVVFTALFPVFVFAQPSFPQLTVKDPKLTCFAFTHANIQLNEQTTGLDYTLVIRGGKIVAAGKGVVIPTDAVVTDVKGQWIYPSFIDPFSTYGINQKTDKNNAPKKAALGWNEAIRSDVDAFEHFEPDDKQWKQLLEMGYGCVSSFVRDGIVRGASTLVLPGNKPDNELVLRKQSALHYSFDKGTSPNQYPSSLMGSIALLRQTHLDAQWYAAGGNKLEYNYTLERFNQLQNLPVIFEVESKQSALRALKIAKEFNKNWIVKGNGTEYQWAAELKQTGASFIVPLQLPKTYNIQSAEMAEFINTADLLHWYMAPKNASILKQNNVPFAFTAEGLDKETFWKNLAKVQSGGLNATDLVKALCTEPARLLKIEDITGSIAAGKLANFFIATTPLGEEDFEITEHWIKGEQHVLPGKNKKMLEGTFALSNNGTFTVKGNSVELKLSNDSCKGTLEYVQGSKGFAAICQCSKNALSVTGWIKELTDAALPEAKEIALVYLAQQVNGTKKAAPEDKKKVKENKVDSVFRVSYPFGDYGRTTLPNYDNVLIQNTTVWTNEVEGILEQTDVAIKDGKIAAVGKKLNAAGIFGKSNYTTLDGTNKHLANGIIDEHSHIAIDNGVNECTHSNTAEVRIGDVVDNEDINIYRQLAGGVTGAQLLHGSCNPIGGQSQLIKLRWGALPEQMKFEGADGFIKFALGENVKRGGWNDPTFRFPQTRMGVEQVMVNDFTRAKQYALDKSAAVKNKTPFRTDLEMETLNEILNKKRFITCHSYVQSEISMLMRVADSLGFKVNTFTHILEGYKVADEMKKHGASASTFSDWWAYKYEVIDAIPQNACLLTKAGVTTAINSDDAEMGRRLNQEAAKSIRYCNMSREEAWKMVTLNPAKMLHVDNRVGSIKVGKDADVVLWSNDPLSIYAKVEKTWIDGKRYFDAEEDLKLYQQNIELRNWLFKKMLEAQAAGEPAREGRSRPPRNYHCED